MRDKSTGRDCDPDPFVPRKPHKFGIGPNSNPNKVARWMRRGGGVEMNEKRMEKARRRHIHPRIKRPAVA